MTPTASEYAYLQQGLLRDHALRPDLPLLAEAVARRWLDERLDPAPLEVAAETMARWAEGLGDARVSAQELASGLAFLGLAAWLVWNCCCHGLWCL